MKMYDLHSHFLPGVDDGCKTAEEAQKVLENSFLQGVVGMFATPHYYPVESVSDFLKRRDEAQNRLCSYLQENSVQIPQLCMGAEVAYRPGLCYEEELPKLCLGSSRYMLLELPFSRWGTEVIRDIRNICNVKGIIPILAHIERYIPIQSAAMLQQVLEMDVLVQMNAGQLLRFGDRRRGCKLLKEGAVQLLGSDCHNLTSRPQNMRAALEYLEKRKMHETADRVMRFGQRIFQEAVEK